MSKLIKIKFIVYIVITFFCMKINAQNTSFAPFISAGSSGIGLGINYKKYNLFCRYYYEYDEPNNSMFFYFHFPEIVITKAIYSEDIGQVYTGFSYSNSVYKQKYIIPGINTTNYYIAIPLGIQLTPFRKSDKFSIILESGIQFMHTPISIHPLIKGYDWQINLARGVIDVRYKLGKNSRR